jgi:hypothetical protein
MSAERQRPQLHFSGLAMLWKCGVKFEFRYVKGIRRPQTSALVVGKGVDSAANANLQNKIDKQELLPLEQVTEIARDAVVSAVNEEGLQPEAGQTEAAARDLSIDKAVRLVTAHAEKLAPKLKPKSVQKKWSLTIPGFPFDLVGTRDLDETDGAIRDLKTSKKSPNRNAADISEQLTTYALSKFSYEGVMPPKVALDTVVDLKRETKVVTQESVRTKDDFQVLMARTENAARVIESGIFTPALPDAWWCSEKWCEYATICPYFRRPISVAIEGEE